MPGRVPPSLMIALSKPITDAEVEAAAAYFSALRPRKRIKVVESDCSFARRVVMQYPSRLGVVTSGRGRQCDGGSSLGQ